jgi:thiamine biosynthesis lipoprotein
MKRRTILSAALGAAALGVGGWLGGRSRWQEFATGGVVFGTTASLRVLHEDEAGARTALSAAMAALRGVDRLMSLHRPDSELSRLNRDGVLEQPDPRLLSVLQAAQATAQLTGGAFDVTVQPLWDAANGSADPAAALARVGWRKLEVGAERVRLSEPGMAVTLNGIAQGYGADVALAALRAHGIAHALLDTGEFGSLGQRDDGQPWTLAVRDPRDPQAAAQLLSADGRCLATSGDYETAFSADFSRHHIVDPKTGASPQELASVSVLAPTGLQADALSTACMVLGMEKSLQLAARLPQVDVLCIAKSGEVRKSAGFPGAPRSA